MYMNYNICFYSLPLILLLQNFEKTIDLVKKFGGFQFIANLNVLLDIINNYKAKELNNFIRIKFC